MSSTRIHPHHSLPAPVIHAGFSIPQSKSHVLAGVQDAYWSDDEAVSLSVYSPSPFLTIFFLPKSTGGRGMSVVFGGDGYLRSQFQTLYMWLPGGPQFSSSDESQFTGGIVRFVASVGTISRRISTVAALLAGEYTQMMLLSLNL